MAITEARLVEMLGKSDRMIRNYAAKIAEVTGRNPQSGPREYHDWALAEFQSIANLGGPKAYERAKVSQPQPQPIATESRVYDMASRRDGYASQSTTQPAAVAFEIVPVNPAAELAIAPIHSGPSNLIPFAPIAQQAQINIQSTQYAITAARQLVQGVRSRVQIGSDTAWTQQQQVTDELAALDLEIAQLEVEGQLYRQQQIRTQAVQHLAGDEVGKRMERLQRLAAANGYQLQPQSS
jgi:hypothetical protein